MAETILIVEDDPTLLRVLKDNLTREGYGVETAQDGEAGLQQAVDSSPDLILLDIMLPRLNGYEVCRLVRQAGLEMPIIMLTAKGQESDIVLGLNLGADDYVTKPFSIRELLARIQAFLRRRNQGALRFHRFGDCELDLESRRLRRAGVEVALTPTEFDLLTYFVSRPGRALSRDNILRTVWGHGVFVTARSVDRCINTLRGKIEPDPRHATYIQTVREIGYRFEPPPSSDPESFQI
jgi:DNA-binding response OmpR family regulator